MICCPNLKQLSLSYNAITKIEGLDRLRGLVELNLAENAISKVCLEYMLTVAYVPSKFQRGVLYFIPVLSLID